MSRPKRDLGKLSGLLTVASDAGLARAGAQLLAVDQLTAGTAQPRRVFDPAALESLASSIRAEGILQPLLVRAVGGRYEIVAGERRWRAAQLAGLKEVPVLIRELDDRQALVAGLMENLQRQNLNVIDEVDAKLALAALALDATPEQARSRLMQLLKEADGPDHAAMDALFTPLGESWRSYAKNKLRILNWPPTIVDALRSGVPRTLAAVIVAAPAEDHAALIARAKAGATREELVAELRNLVPPAAAPHAERALLVGRTLSDRRFLSQLDPADRKAVDKWLERMPDVVRARLDAETVNR